MRLMIDTPVGSYYTEYSTSEDHVQNITGLFDLIKTNMTDLSHIRYVNHEGDRVLMSGDLVRQSVVTLLED